jgi:cytochrome c553
MAPIAKLLNEIKIEELSAYFSRCPAAPGPAQQ